ncbi:MAG: Uma2 family endonuclease [Fimbriiglobus sp.]
MNTETPKTEPVVYPESDGKPMADNTLQWDWMVKIVGELREQFAGKDVFVAGDLFWYPVEGNPKVVAAPDALVAFGRPPGYRGTYKQWAEAGIAPQVVFEVLSPSNTDDELDAKLVFFQTHGVEEYYFLDPLAEEYEAYVRRGGVLAPVRQKQLDGFVSPRLGVTFRTKDGLKLFGPDGHEFRTREDAVAGLQEELRRTNEVVDEERQRRLAADRRAEQLAAKLRELGVNPDDVLRPAG